MKIGIIGTGVYSTAIAIQLAKKCDNVVMWCESKDRVLEFKQTHKIEEILPNITIPNNISVTSSYEDTVVDANIVFLISMAKYTQSICDNIKKLVNNNTHFCIASKGIDDETSTFLSDIVINTLNTSNVAVLSGPTFAIDLANNHPCALTIASKSLSTINLIQDILNNDNIKLGITDDLIGVQLCGSIKNVFAIASGIINGLGYQESTRAFLITEALYNINKLLIKLGGNEKTILSYAGIGDLILTCTSNKSRNYSFGELLGKKSSKKIVEEFLKNNTVEGYTTLQSLYKLINLKHIEIPLINILYQIIINGEDPTLLTKFLTKKNDF